MLRIIGKCTSQHPFQFGGFSLCTAAPSAAVHRLGGLCSEYKQI